MSLPKTSKATREAESSDAHCGVEAWEKEIMMDKIYTAMDNAGKYNLVAGICLIVTSLATCVCGAFMIVHAARLLRQKNHL